MDQLKLVSRLGSGLGAPYARPAGIPQGCPAPMLALSILSVRWGRLAARLGAVPRGLADDFVLCADGHLAQQQVEAATEGLHAMD